MSDTKTIDLEMCVNKEHAQIQPAAECEDCEGYNNACPSYYSVRDKIGKIKIRNNYAPPKPFWWINNDYQKRQ